MGRTPTTCCSSNTIVSWVCRVCSVYAVAASALLTCWACLAWWLVGDEGSKPSEANYSSYKFFLGSFEIWESAFFLVL
jgi:hypothetical protein